MTVIAWDGKNLAADKLACFGETKKTVTKVFRHEQSLLAICGTLAVGMEMLAWFQAGSKQDQFPAACREANADASLIWVDPDGVVWKFENGPHPFRVEGTFTAFGSGGESAMVAMECGCSAREAVDVVSRYNNSCGNGIDVLRLSNVE